jgi:hypothetical protein
MYRALALKGVGPGAAAACGSRALSSTTRGSACYRWADHNMHHIYAGCNVHHIYAGCNVHHAACFKVLASRCGQCNVEHATCNTRARQRGTTSASPPRTALVLGEVRYRGTSGGGTFIWWVHRGCASAQPAAPPPACVGECSARLAAWKPGRAASRVGYTTISDPRDVARSASKFVSFAALQSLHVALMSTWGCCFV